MDPEIQAIFPDLMPTALFPKNDAIKEFHGFLKVKVII